MSLRRLAAALQHPAIIAAIWIGALFMFGHAMALLPERSQKLDFSNYYESAWALRHGINPYITDLTPIGDRLGLETSTIVHAADTPTLLAVIEPFTLLSPSRAFFTWTALKGIALAVSLYLLLANRPGISKRTAWLLLGLALMYRPLNEDFAWGQTQIFALMLLVLAMRAMEAGRDAAAGIAIAAASLMRAYPVLLFGYLLFTRRWRALKFGVAAATVGALITIAVIGVRNCLSFVDGAVWVVRFEQTIWGIDLSLGPFVSRVFWLMFHVAPDSAGDSIRKGAVFAAELAVLALTIGTTLKTVAAAGQNAEPNRRDPNWRIYGLWIATAIFISPIGWNHYKVLLFIPFVQMVAAASLGESGARPILAAAVCYALASFTNVTFVWLVTAPPEWIEHHRLLFVTLQEVGFAGMLAGFMSAYWFATDYGDAASAPREVAAVGLPPRAHHA